MFDPYMQAYWSGGWPGVEMLAPAPQPIKHHTLRQRLLRAMESVKDDMPLSLERDLAAGVLTILAGAAVLGALVGAAATKAVGAWRRR
jgi:hypothetical protein